MRGSRTEVQEAPKRGSGVRTQPYTGQQTLCILLWSDESQMLRGFDVPYYPPSTYSISLLPSLTLSLLLSSLPLLPGVSCASSHILLVTFTPFVYSLYLSHLILSASSLLSSLKSECLSHASGNKDCQVSLKGGVVCVCRNLMQVFFYLSPIQLFMSQHVTKNVFLPWCSLF